MTDTPDTPKHRETCICGKRAPVQASQQRSVSPEYRERLKDIRDHGSGTIAWAEHLEAHAAYAAEYGNQQSAERMAERGGFSYFELFLFLGHEPKTWEPRR